MKRPAQYVPLSVTFHTGRTGTAILDEYGLAGLCVWVVMLATAKTERPPGTIRFSHAEDWGHLGLGGHRPDFELTEFLTFLGRRKLTRTRRSGQVMYVTLTRWEQWNQAVQTEEARLRKSRSRAQSTSDIPSDQSVTQRLELEREDPLPPLHQTPKPQPNGTDPVDQEHEPYLSELTDEQRAELAQRMADIGNTIGT